MSNKQHKQQTAMQALVELLKVNDIYKECMPYIIEIIDEVYLPMEKKQMKKSWGDGFSFQSPYKNFEEYYKENYNK